MIEKTRSGVRISNHTGRITTMDLANGLVRVTVREDGPSAGGAAVYLSIEEAAAVARTLLISDKEVDS